MLRTHDNLVLRNRLLDGAQHGVDGEVAGGPARGLDGDPLLARLLLWRQHDGLLLLLLLLLGVLLLDDGVGLRGKGEGREGDAHGLGRDHGLALHGAAGGDDEGAGELGR